MNDWNRMENANYMESNSMLTFWISNFAMLKIIGKAILFSFIYSTPPIDIHCPICSWSWSWSRFRFRSRHRSRIIENQFLDQFGFVDIQINAMHWLIIHFRFLLFFMLQLPFGITIIVGLSVVTNNNNIKRIRIRIRTSHELNKVAKWWQHLYKISTIHSTHFNSIESTLSHFFNTQSENIGNQTNSIWLDKIQI